MAVVAAAKAIEQLGGGEETAGQPRSPAQSAGITIVIEGAAKVLTPPTIDVDPVDAPRHPPPSVE